MQFIKKISFLIALTVLVQTGNTQISHIINEPVQPAVTILHTDPVQPVEGMPVIIYFRFTNNNLTGATLNGWIGADINSGTGAPGTSLVDWEIKELAPKQSVDGAVFVRAPDAGINRLIRVFFYETKTVSGDQISKSSPLYIIGQGNISVAALISFRLQNFTIRHTRARNTDTDYGSLFVSLNDQAVMQPASNFLGNFRDGNYTFDQPVAQLMQQAYTATGPAGMNPPLLNSKFDSGPFAVVPGVNSIVKTAYFIYNGGSITNSEGFLKGFADATANPELFKGPRPGRTGWFDAMRVLCPPLNIIGACDGFVVADSMMIQTNDLFAVTGNGNVTITRKFESEEFASQTGCGNTSKYEVESKVNRLSYPGMGESNSPIYASVTANRRINIFSSWTTKSTPVVWERLETISPAGDFITVTDPAYGFVTGNVYKAPKEITKPLLVILRGIRPQLQIGNDQYDLFAGSSLRNVTAIIQLIPGQTIRGTRPGADNIKPSIPPRGKN